jgi:N-acetylmuramoyl-L-alanine amidase
MKPTFLTTFLRLYIASCCLTWALPSGAVAGNKPHQTAPYIVVLDPGHGGSDTGAVDNGLIEKLLTLQIARRAAKDLRSMGYSVFLTRWHDQDVNTPPRDVNGDGTIDHVDELDARNVYANRHHGDIIVSIHFDAAAGDPSKHGTHGYYCPARAFWQKSRHLANILTTSVAAALTRAGYPSPDNGVDTDVADKIPQARADYPWFLILGPSRPRWLTGTAMPGALVETLYLTSPGDAAALGRPNIISAIAQGYANGIRTYFNGQTRHS